MPSSRSYAFARAGIAYTILGLFVCSYFSRSTEWNAILAILAGGQFSAALYGTGVFGIAVICTLAVSAVFGRVFCSVLCPMGAAQELFFRIWRSGKARFVSPLKVRFLTPFLAGLAVAVLGEPLITMDPISNFGRGLSEIAAVLQGGAGWREFIELALPFFLVLTLAFFRGRRFCDWCPVGLTLGLLSSAAPFGMRISEGCVSCGLCEKKCPANCVNAREKTIMRDRCVLCFSCQAVCKGGFASYGKTWLAGFSGRREFLKASVARASAFFSCVLFLAGPSLSLFASRGGTLGVQREGNGGEGSGGHILPPGGGDIERYLSLCVGCQACVAACPVRIVKAKNSPHPELDYSGDFCQYNCTECGRVCPTRAIRRLSVEEKRRTRVALSSLTFEKCVVVTKDQACGACAEVCPTRSLRMVPYTELSVSGLTKPVFDEAYCIGCGACLAVCPAVPVAFSVDAVSQQTLTPGIRPTDGSEDVPPLPGLDEFPF
ncbi:MAG: 4Fe-4S dicluster domain-containing protein [Synergistaceae bacterium]|jgi:ferredoxin|nr:4Fe-4S dicluster domain-containing protein [Synergistaceae bacterium]